MADKSEFKHIEKTLSKRKELNKLIVTAALLAFGIGVLSSGLIAFAKLPIISLLTIGILSIAISLLLLTKRLFSNLEFTERFEAKFFVSNSSNKVLPVEGYKFADELSDTLDAAFVESKSLLRDWESEPIVKLKKDDHKVLPLSSDESQKKPQYMSIVKTEIKPEDMKSEGKGAQVIKEAIEFMLLEELSTHLSTYFTDYEENDNLIFEIQRKDIPSFLLENRILSLLSTPIEQRDIFIDAFPDEEKRPKGEIHALYGSDGSKFTKFHLIMPAGTNVTRSKSGEIVIENKRIILKLKIDFMNFNSSVDNNFIGYYMKNNPQNVEVKQAYIFLTGKIKPISLLASSGWDYYRWLDSYRIRMYEFCSFKYFSKKIGWPNLSAFIRISSRPKDQKKSSTEEESEENA